MGKRTFRCIGSINTASSNLTELNATDAVNHGFMDHSDWLAHVERYAIVMNWLKHNRGHGLRILDVGCGRFPLLTYFWRNRAIPPSMSYTGIDLRAKQAWLEDSLPEQVDVELVQMDIIADDPSSLGKFDVVVCTEMLEHVDKKHAGTLIRNLRAWVKEDGVMFLSSPNLGGSDTVAENHTAPDGSPREWTYEGKVKLIGAGDFEIIDSIGTFIRLDHIPDEFWTPATTAIKKRLPNSFFRVFAAAAYPAESNNAMFICKPR